MADLDGVDATDRQRELAEYVAAHGPVSRAAVAAAFDIKENTVSDHLRPFRQAGVITLTDAGEYVHRASDTDLPDLTDVPVAGDPDPDDLTDREEYIARELQTGATVEELAEDLEERPTVITQHLRDLKREGWQVYVDESAEHVAIEGDHTLRSSEHKGTRTRKANRWWEQRHNQLVREYKGLDDVPGSVAPDPDPDSEDWVFHLTDVHAGDFVRQDDGTVVYKPEIIPDVINYATRQSIHLADVHNATYDTAHILLGGDLVTGEGVYEGQLENGDVQAFMDEQIDLLHDPLLQMCDAYAERFNRVEIICQIGNHGDIRADGTSKQANADLIAYKNLRNTIAALRDRHGEFENLAMKIGEARAYRNFDLRGGKLTGHLRHGQDRDPQASTSARLKEWMSTLLDHEFDLAYLGHHHVTGLIPWDGPPILASPSPKPAGEFVENIGGRVPGGAQGVATAHGVSDDGLTGVFPIDMRKYDQ